MHSAMIVLGGTVHVISLAQVIEGKSIGIGEGLCYYKIIMLGDGALSIL